MHRKTRKTLFARVRSCLIGRWTGHSIDGLADNDIIEGGDGDDAIRADGIAKPGYLNSTDIASHGADFLDGGAGNDYLEGAGKADQLFGGVGNDQLWGDVTATAMSDSDINAFLWGADYLDGEDGENNHYKFRSCLRPYLLGKSTIQYPKTVQKSPLVLCVSRRRTKSRIQNTPNSIAGCARKQGAVAIFDGRKGFQTIPKLPALPMHQIAEVGV